VLGVLCEMSCRVCERCFRFVVCNDCGRKLHQICAQYMSEIWPDEFVCDICLREKDEKRKENKYSAKRKQQHSVCFVAK